jgi:capsular exopolysaccharide synthesis family protein
MKRIAITSHESSDGKTFIAIRIAKSMAERGKKTLLIDGDLRKSSITLNYRVKHISVGLAHLLSGQCTLEDAIYSTNIPNLSLLPSGEIVKAPLPLLTSPEFEELMDILGSEYDIIIVDTPPVGVVIDAAEIAKRCDGSLLVLEYNKQSKGSLRYIQGIMEQANTPIIGCVINKVSPKKLTEKRYYQYKKDYYSYSYIKESKQKTRSKAKGRSK